MELHLSIFATDRKHMKIHLLSKNQRKTKNAHDFVFFMPIERLRISG